MSGLAINPAEGTEEIIHSNISSSRWALLGQRTLWSQVAPGAAPSCSLVQENLWTHFMGPQSRSGVLISRDNGAVLPPSDR